MQSRRAVLACIGNAYIQWRRDRVVSDFWVIVACPAFDRKARLVQRVVQASNSGNVHVCVVEQILPAGDRPAAFSLRVIPAQTAPAAVEIEYVRIERLSCRVLAQRIIDPDKTLRQLIGKSDRPAIPSVVTREIYPGVVEDLRSEDTT